VGENCGLSPSSDPQYSRRFFLPIAPQKATRTRHCAEKREGSKRKLKGSISKPSIYWKKLRRSRKDCRCGAQWVKVPGRETIKKEKETVKKGGELREKKASRRKKGAPLGKHGRG